MNNELAKQEAVTITERIRVNGQIAVNAVCAIGKDLRKMKVEKLYEHMGYDSFENYAESEFNLKRRQAYQYISVYENLGEEFVQSNAQLGITKLSLLTQINPEDRAEIIKNNDLSGMTVNEARELLEKVKEQGEQLSMFETENAELREKLDIQLSESELNELKTKAEKADILSNRLDEMNKNCRRIADQRDTAQRRINDLESQIKELESRPVDVAVPEPEIREVIKEVIKEVPDKKALEEKDREILTLRNKYKALDEARKEEAEKLRKSYEARISELQKPPESSGDTEKSSFKLLYAEAYKSCLGLVEFVKSAEEDERSLFTEKTEKLLEVVKESLHGGNKNE